MEGTYSQKVRETAIVLDEFTIDDLLSKVPVYSYKELRRVKDKIREFKKSGKIVLVRPGVYRYQSYRKPLTIQARMWRAMKIKEFFTRRDILMLTGASFDYVQKYFIFLKRNGFIKHVSGRGYKGGLYQLIDPMKVPSEYPVFNRRHISKMNKEKRDC